MHFDHAALMLPMQRVSQRAAAKGRRQYTDALASDLEDDSDEVHDDEEDVDDDIIPSRKGPPEDRRFGAPPTLLCCFALACKTARQLSIAPGFAVVWIHGSEQAHQVVALTSL